MADEDTVVYTNATVRTCDVAFRTARAFIVRDGRFEAVDPPVDGGRATVVDLDGRTVVPGFIDAHAHLATRARESLAEPRLTGLTSVRQITDAIRAHVRAHPGPGLVQTSPLGEGPDYFGLPETLDGGRWPTRAELDEVSDTRAILIPTPQNWPHPAILNTPALRLLGLWDPGDAPPGVRVERDADGAPTGRVDGINPYNRTRLNREVADAAGTPASAQWRDALAGAMAHSLSAGVTSCYEPHNNLAHEHFVALRATGRLPMRIAGTLEAPATAGVTEVLRFLEDHAEAHGAGTGDDRLRLRGFTVSLDGAIQFGRAHMREPYRDPWGELTNGSSVLSADDLYRIGEAAIATDSRLHLLGAGQGAIDIIVGALARLHGAHDLRGREWAVLHMQHPSRDDIARLAAMEIRAQSYTSVDFSKGLLTYRDRLPDDVAKTVVPARWWLDGGIALAQGSDGAHPEPLFHVWDALLRLDGRTGASTMSPAKRVSRRESLLMCTRNAARVMGTGESLGSIEPGKLADFVVLDADPMTVPVEAIRDIGVVATVIGGEVVYGELPPPRG